MRILLCTGIFPPEPGGPATYTKLLAEELVTRGHEVKVITYSNRLRKSEVRSQKSDRGNQIPTSTVRPPTPDLRFSVVRINRSSFKPWHYFKYFRAVKKLGRDFDILYAQDPVSAGYPTMLAARVLKKPYVVKVTGDYSWEQAMGRKFITALIDEFQNLPHYPFWIKLMRRIQIRVCKEANLVITPSQYLKRLLMGWGVKEKIIRVIYNAAPPLNLPLIKGEKERGLDFRIVSVGRDVRWKGFEVLREAVLDLEKEISKIKLVILQKESREEVLRNLADANVFVLNSAYEGTSHVILEAMALGTPVVTTNVGGNPEVVTPGVVILVEFNNKEQIKAAILKLYREPELRQKLSSGAKKVLKDKFLRDDMVNKTIVALHSIIPNS